MAILLDLGHKRRCHHIWRRHRRHLDLWQDRCRRVSIWWRRIASWYFESGTHSAESGSTFTKAGADCQSWVSGCICHVLREVSEGWEGSGTADSSMRSAWVRGCAGAGGVCTSVRYRATSAERARPGLSGTGCCQGSQEQHWPVQSCLPNTAHPRHGNMGSCGCWVAQCQPAFSPVLGLLDGCGWEPALPLFLCSSLSVSNNPHLTPLS